MAESECCSGRNLGGRQEDRRGRCQGWALALWASILQVRTCLAEPRESNEATRRKHSRHPWYISDLAIRSCQRSTSLGPQKGTFLLARTEPCECQEILTLTIITYNLRLHVSHSQRKAAGNTNIPPALESGSLVFFSPSRYGKGPQHG